MLSMDIMLFSGNVHRGGKTCVSRQEMRHSPFTAMVTEGNRAAVKTGTAQRGASPRCTVLGLQRATESKGVLLIKAH